MNILLYLTTLFVIINAAATEKKLTPSTATASNETTKETRGKRNLNLFNIPVSSNRRSDAYNYQPTAYNYDTNQNFHGIAPDHHRNNFHNYPEALEPIIEIIIQDNNETLPEPQYNIQSNGKKKKEQVQVFYVKYHKDEKKGLVIHEPVAALSPVGHEQDHEEEENRHDDLTIVTPVPNIPRKTTTLRTIIRPESEQYESSSGVHVTFNKPHNHNSKSDNHIHDEEKVESAIQPVIQLPQNRVGSLPVLPIKEKRQQPQFLPTTQGRIVNQNGNFHNVPQNHIQSLTPHQRPPADFVPQNNFIKHSHHSFLSNQLTLPSQEPSKPFHPNNIHQQQPLTPISIPINHHQQQQGVLGHQQQISHRLPPLQVQSQAPHLKPPQRAPAPQVNFNQNQRPFNYHAHASQVQNIQRPLQSPSLPSLPSQNFQNINQQLPPLNRPPTQFNSQYPTQQFSQFPPNQGPQFIPPAPSKLIHQQAQQNHFSNNNNPNVFQGGLVEQAAPNLAVRPVQYQQLPQQAAPPLFQNSSPQKDIHFNQQKFIQSTFGSDVQVSSSVPKFEHHITETVNPPVYFKPTALDMDKLPQHHESNKNIGPLIGTIGNLMVTQKPLTQHRFASHPVGHQNANHNQFSFPSQENAHFQSPPNSNLFEVNARNNYVTSTATPIKSTVRQTTTFPKTTTETPRISPSSTTMKPKAYFDLPEEIPDDLRKQLEESGVLDNAQISILDYDKIGDTSLQDLPPEHLANFFSAGGAAQIGANSNKVISLLKPNGESVVESNKDLSKLLDATKNGKSPKKKEDINLRVVKFDMQPEIGAKNQNFSRYIPIKINGNQFPITGIEEDLSGKKIVSVVVLAPVSQNREGDKLEAGQIKFLSGDNLKNLIKKPSQENFKRWFESEQKNEPELQSVVLLVARDSKTNEQEIFMYDRATRTIAQLDGELSKKFVNVAEENANVQDEIGEDIQIDRIDTDIEEQEGASSNNFEKIVDLNGRPVNGDENHVFINEGYSVIKNE